MMISFIKTKQTIKNAVQDRMIVGLKEKKRKETEVRETPWAWVKRSRIEELLLWMKWFSLVLGLSKPIPHFKWIPKKLIKLSK